MMEIAIDFDGTCVSHAFPKVGEDIGAVPVLKKLVKAGHHLILWTMRGDRKENKPTGHKDILDVTGAFLQHAIDWFKENEIPLYACQANPTQKDWTNSPKCYAHMYIDDAALGCPLVYPENGDRPYADWKAIEKLLKEQNII